MFNKTAILASARSRYDNYCDGYSNTRCEEDGYILGVFIGIGKTSVNLGHEGSNMLDEITAFDKAEVDGANMGQINMITVSSFCGPRGLIWGYDLARPKDLYRIPSRKSFPRFVINPKGEVRVPICSIRPLVKATQTLLGTVDRKVYPILPGAHVPCAGKNIKAKGPIRIYSGLAIGIAENRERDACLLMEDTGTIPSMLKGKNLIEYEDMITLNLARSILEVGNNQRVKYKEIFVGIKSIHVEKDSIACSLVACPYLTLAQNAFIKKGDGSLDLQKTIKSTLDTWKNLT